MTFTFADQPHKIPGTYYFVDKSGHKTLRYLDGSQYIFKHTARKPPVKHLTIYKYTKKIINKLLTFIDSKFFYGE